MINDFLKKYQSELITEKIQLKEDMDLLDTKIREESKFLDLLESSNDSYFTEFTPRNVNEKNNEKAAEVRELLEKLNEEQTINASKMKFYDSRLLEVNSLINSNSSKSLKKVDVYKVNEDTSLNENKNIDVSLNDSISSKLTNLKNLILLDPYRASLEIDDIIASIK